MKLLASYNLTEARKDSTISPVEVWRIMRPLEQLRKHTDWQIDESIGIFQKKKKFKNVTEEEMSERLNYFGQYDVVIGSYYSNPLIHSFTMVVQQKTKTRFAMSVDDNIFQIDPLNPIFTVLDEKYLNFMKVIVEDASYIIASTEPLAEVLRERRVDKRPETVVVIPNMISTDHYKHESYDNGDKIVIGYMGGSSHYGDLHNTGLMDALRQIMHENKNVYFETVGMPIDSYLPKARQRFIGGERGHEAWYKLFGTLKFDIGLAPLEDTPFTRCKSNIKWQEYSIMGATVVASKVGPYGDTIKHGSDGWLVENNYESWYNALKILVQNSVLRKKIAGSAKKRVINEFSIEKNWQKIKDGIETIAKV